VKPSQYTQSDRVLLTELGDGTGVLLHMDTKFYYTLNNTGVALWKALDKGKALDIPAMAAVVAEQFAVEPEIAEGDIAPLLADMTAENLILVK